MTKLIILGSSNSIPDEKHDNTHMVLLGQNSKILVDCATNPIIRLQQAHVNVLDLTDIILTHFHPDHVSGLPLLLMDMWLMGRKRPLNIYGLHYTLERIENLMGFYAWENWPEFYPISFHQISGGELVPLINNDEFIIEASLVNHMIPCMGVRMKIISSGKVVAYSSDTEPCSQVIRMAEKADFLFHEATGLIHGYSSAMQAGDVASQAEAKVLYLIHYPTGEHPVDQLTSEAGLRFNGPVHLAEDFLSLDL
jgi:ribonuclease Z